MDDEEEIGRFGVLSVKIVLFGELLCDHAGNFGEILFIEGIVPRCAIDAAPVAEGVTFDLRFTIGARLAFVAGGSPGIIDDGETLRGVSERCAKKAKPAK